VLLAVSRPDLIQKWERSEARAYKKTILIEGNNEKDLG